MKLPRVLRSTILIATFVLLPARCAPGDNERTRNSLRGLAGAEVLIEGLSADAKQDGLNEQDIQTDVELTLRLAGIKVLTRRESITTPGIPCLYVNVGLLSRGGTYTSSIEVSLEQEALLERDPTIRTTVATWSVGSIGIVGKTQIRGAIKDEIDKFLNAYLSVNPKK